MYQSNKCEALKFVARRLANFVKIAIILILVLSPSNSFCTKESIDTSRLDFEAQRITPISSDSQIGSNEIDVSNKCANAEANLDRCSAQLIAFGQGGMELPVNMNQLDNVYCPNFRRIVHCIGNSTACYKPFQRQIINWVLTSSRRLNYKRCKNDNEKSKFLRLIQSCASVMRTDSCMNDYIANLEGIADLERSVDPSGDDIQIHLSCCANRKFHQCVMNNAKHQCKAFENLKKLKRTNSNSSQRMAQKSMQKALLSMMDDLKLTLNAMALTGPELICRTVDDNFCNSRFEGKFKNRVARHKSIVPLMIRIYSNK